MCVEKRIAGVAAQRLERAKCALLQSTISVSRDRRQRNEQSRRGGVVERGHERRHYAKQKRNIVDDRASDGNSVAGVALLRLERDDARIDARQHAVDKRSDERLRRNVCKRANRARQRQRCRYSLELLFVVW